MRGLVLVLCLVSGIAGADEPPPPAAPAPDPANAPTQSANEAAQPAGPPAGPMMDPDSEVSRRNYERGIDLYDKGEYVEAIKVFQAANLARPAPALLFDIARCYDRMGDWHRALQVYEQFWQVAPPAQRTQDVQQRIATLNERLDRELYPVEQAKKRRWRIAAVTSSAVAVVSFAIGGAMYGWAKADRGARRDYCESLAFRNCVPSEYSDLSARANASYALFAIGGIAAAADVALWVLAMKDRPRVHAWIAPTSRGLSLGASF